MTSSSSGAERASQFLFEPFRIGKLELPNRIVMAPMTRSMAPGGVPGPANAAYYRRRAEGEVGLIVSEGTVVDRPGARNMPGIPVFHGEAALAGWKSVIDAVHEAGGKMGPQLWHVGAVGGPDRSQQKGMESPSGLFKPGKPMGAVMSETDIQDTIAAFARSAADAQRLGFDVIELHGAHGYLIDQFFWSGTNQREDAWGGATLPERARFAAEVVKAVRAAIGPDMPLILRVSQWKQQAYEARLAETPDALAEWLVPLAEAGVDVFHCSQRRFWEPEFPELDGDKGLNFAGWVKKQTGRPTISVGSVGLDGDFFAAFQGSNAKTRGLDDLAERMEKEEFDLIAVGRALLSDPEWPKKIREGQPQRGFAAEDLQRLV